MSPHRYLAPSLFLVAALAAPAESEKVTPPEAKALSWACERAIPLKTVEAGHGFADMEPLRAVVGDARIVGLGEATHGTREFFQLKHRMLEFLVEEMGFSVFAIEANLPEAFAVDDYVLTGEGDPADALESMYFWTWNTEEVLAQIEWMRAYNADPAHTRKLRFYGFDMQTPVVAALRTRRYLRGVSAETADAFAATLAPLSVRDARDEWGELTKEQRDEVIAQLGTLVEHFDADREGWVAKGGAADWQRHRQYAVLLQQAARNLAAGFDPDTLGFNVRDRAMADNVDWILETEPAGSKIVLWAHNGHVAADRRWTMLPMGRHLRERHGDDYVVFGFAFNQGAFQAQGMGAAKRGLHERTVGPAPAGSVGALLAGCELPLLALDLRQRPGDPRPAWFDRPQVHRQIGAVFENEETMSSSMDTLPRLYDALLFVDTTTRARPVHR